MTQLIEWCNTNNGFLTAILAVLSLFISFWAVVVSIRTAKLPYKKAILLNTSVSLLFEKNLLTGDVASAPAGISVTATNIGNRAVTLSFVGLAIRGNGRKIQKMAPLDRQLEGAGLLSPSEMTEASYNRDELLVAFSRVKRWKTVYACAVDTEGKLYLRRRGNIRNAISILSH